MAELSTLARPYAKAAFQTALGQQQLGEWSQGLASLAAVIEQPAVESLIGNPSLASTKKASILKDLLADSLSDGLARLVDALADNGRLTLLGEIARQYEQHKANQEKTADVTITSAYPLSQEQEQTLVSKLAEKLDRHINLTVTVDEHLLGGAVIKTGDTQIDGSVRGKLIKLADAMNS